MKTHLKAVVLIADYVGKKKGVWLRLDPVIASKLVKGKIARWGTPENAEEKTIVKTTKKTKKK